jgi:hypothetical protein
MIEHIRIYNIDEIDFDGLFNASLEKMDSGTYVWNNGIDTYESKYAFVKDHTNHIFQQPNFFGYKLVVDGSDLGAVLGSLNNKTFVSSISFFKPDANGSRAYIYNPDVPTDYVRFLKEHDVEEVLSFMTFNSSIKKTMSHNFGIDEESYKTFQSYPDDMKHLEFQIFKFNIRN